MSVPISLHVSARCDLVDIGLWYEDQRGRAERRVRQRVDETLNDISECPNSFPVTHNSATCVLVPHFPYAIYFEVMPDHVIVLAVVHTARSPRAWRRRV